MAWPGAAWRGVESLKKGAVKERESEKRTLSKEGAAHQRKGLPSGTTQEGDLVRCARFGLLLSIQFFYFIFVF